VVVWALGSELRRGVLDYVQVTIAPETRRSCRYLDGQGRVMIAGLLGAGSIVRGDRWGAWPLAIDDRLRGRP